MKRKVNIKKVAGVFTDHWMFPMDKKTHSKKHKVAIDRQ